LIGNNIAIYNQKKKKYINFHILNNALNKNIKIIYIYIFILARKYYFLRLSNNRQFIRPLSEPIFTLGSFRKNSDSARAECLMYLRSDETNFDRITDKNGLGKRSNIVCS